MKFDSGEIVSAYNNSFNVIILGYDWEDIVSGSSPFFVHNPAKKYPRRGDIQNLIDYFIEQEEYLKCKNLKEYLEREYETE